MKESVILIRYGEIHLKGKNRPYFEKLLQRRIKESIRDFSAKLERGQGRYYITGHPIQDEELIINRLKCVFGIYSISVARKTSKNWEEICDVACELMKKEINLAPANPSFKVAARRSDKAYHMNSMEMAAELGGIILNRLSEIHVDVHQPDIILGLEIRESTYIYAGEILCAGGLPVGCNGRAALLLSGGIDSPIAGHMMMKRGLKLDCIHFHSHPYTSDRAKEKVISLAKILARYGNKINLHIVPFTAMQLAIYDNSPASQGTILLRRAMMQISERIALKEYCGALITGEALGQVASQTLESLTCTNNAVDMPVFRPLIGFDKNEIIERAREIGSYETSILPYEDCCTIFTPRNPVIRPKLSEIQKSQFRIEHWQSLMEEAADSAEKLSILPDFYCD